MCSADKGLQILCSYCAVCVASVCGMVLSLRYGSRLVQLDRVWSVMPTRSDWCLFSHVGAAMDRSTAAVHRGMGLGTSGLFLAHSFRFDSDLCVVLCVSIHRNSIDGRTLT